MAFDPDAYLAEGGGVKETPFDPDAYLGIEKPVGTSIGQEISQIPAALKQSFGQPLEAMGETAQVAGFPAVATALKGAIQEPEGYVSAGERFMTPKEGEFQIAGFAPQYAPRAVVEQTGQLIGSIGSRIAGAVTLGGLGAMINPGVGAAGVATGLFAGPALFEAAQIVGPVALERAKNNGYIEPTDKDMAYAIATAAGSGLLNAFGAKYLPGGEKAVGSFAKRLAASFIGEGVPEGLQSFTQQVGETVETQKGIQVSPKQAIGEALIGGGAGAAATTIAVPFTPEQIAEAKITESADKEAENLFIGNDNPQGKAVLANKQKLEQEIADTKQVLQAIESTDPVAQKLKLELKEKEAILAAAQGQVDSIVESADPVAEAEKQQFELAKAITTPEAAPVEPTVKESLPVQPAQEVPLGLNRPTIVDRSLRILSDEEFNKSYLTTKENVDKAEAMIDVAGGSSNLTTDQKIQIAKAQDKWSAIELENFRRSNQNVNTEDLFDKMISLADIGSDSSYAEFSTLMDIIQERGGAKPEQVIALKRILPKQLLDNPNYQEALKGKLTKFKEWMGRYQSEKSEVVTPIAEAAPVEPIVPAPVTEQAAPAEAPAPEVTPKAIKDYATGDINTPFYFEGDSWKVDESRLKSGDEVIETSDGPAIYSRTNDGKVTAIGVNANGRQVYIGESSNSFMPSDYSNVPVSEMFSALKGSRTYESDRAGDLFPAIDQKTAEKLIVKYPPTKPTPAVSETITKPKLGEKGGVLIPTKESTPVADPIGYGNALIDLFPNLKNAGIRAISMEESLANIEQEWQQKLKSGKATRLNELVYLANKKNAEKALSDKGIGGMWSNANKTVAVSSNATPSAMAHEVGHAIMEVEFSQADQKTKDAIIAEYNKWFASTYGKDGVPSVADQRRIWEWMSESDWLDPKAPFPQELRVASWEKYRSSFSEWFADEVAKWATTNVKPKSLVEKFFTEIAAKLNKLWNAVSENFAPNETLATWLDSITDVSPSKVEFAPKGDKIELLEATPEPSKTTRRTRIMGVEAGEEVKTPEGIIAKTQELLRKKFDPTKVSDKNTTEAFRALGKLMGKDGTAFAQELNDIGRVVDESGAASEISMGAALFVNDLFEYAIKLAANGDKKMLGMMMSNINKLPTAAIGASDAARTLRARLELSQRFLTMAQAEQDAYTNYVAEFIYGPNPTKEQIKSIKDAYAAVEKTPQVTEQELTDEIKAVGDRSGTDLVGKINEEFTKATEKKAEQRKTEEAELDREYRKVQKQADAEIEKLAKIQSDTPSFDPAVRQVINEVRAIVANDLKQRPDMESKADWKSALVAKLQQVGVELTAAETLADIVWRQHEINNLSRELSSINKAIEKGPISEIVKAIKNTPLEDQQNPNWRYEVMRDYLRKAGLSVAQSERIAKLMDISLQKRFTMAQEQAFTDAISKTAPWKSGDTRSRRAFQKVLQALRAGALDPARNVLSDMAALNGWTGFTPEQYKVLLKNDAILSDPEAGELKKAEAYKAIQDVISKAKLPIRARDVIGQYYDAQALSGIPTLTVNSFSPIAFAMRNAIVEIGSGTLKGNPKAITNAATAFVDSIKSWANTVAFSFKNNVTVYSNVDYIVNDDNLLRLYRRGVDQFKGGKTARERADGVKNMMIGMMDYVRRILNALDYGAIASLQNQNISKYSMAVMKRQKMSTKEANDMFAVMMKAKNDFYLQQIAIGTDKNKASILADEFYISSWNDALTKAGVEKSDIKQAMDAAINDALSSVGRNRQSLDSLKDESTKLKDAGVSSMPALWLLESMANAANQTENQILKLFSRIIYGYAIVPARVIRETAWFSPYGFVRFGYDAIAKKMGKTSPYAQSLGTDVQYSQRLNEAIAGTVALIALASLRAGSTDEPEEDEFKIVFTGNGPKRSDDPQFYDSWYKVGNKPNTMSVYFGKSKFDLNMMRGFEAFTWPAMMLGALDDLEIRKKQKRETNTASQIEDASIVAGFVFDAALRRGPYAFTTKSLFGTYGDIGVEGIAKGLTFPAKTLIPVLGTSLASNLSNLINDPVDRRTLDGAIWSNIPFIGPAVAPKSLNAFGEPSLSTDMASKMFKLGVPIVYDIPTDRESVILHELVLKQGGGPSIPTRNQLAQRLDRQPTNKEYEMFVKEYGAVLTKSMKKNYEKLSAMKPEAYTKVVERIGNRARDIAENKVRVATKKP